MISTFGPNSQRVLALIAAIPGLSASQVDLLQIIKAQRLERAFSGCSVTPLPPTRSGTPL